ncbi:hypothetical protein ACFC1B_06935 [Streptomyces xiamenensis]|uniref:hypothetical protein n=1 Tax=Streptomyces xiamenensis TaxID=408015 RepID=UPI0035DA0265
MKTVFSAEAIGLSPVQARATRRTDSAEHERRQALPHLWELTGLLGRGFQRQLLKPKQDWSQANSKGTRGVWLYWTLTAGPVYEARYRITWTSPYTHRFLYVTPDGGLHDATEEEVREWLSHLRPAPAPS